MDSFSLDIFDFQVTMITKHSSEITRRYILSKLEKIKIQWDDTFLRYYICHRLPKGQRYGFLWLKRREEDETKEEFRKRCYWEVYERIDLRFSDKRTQYEKMFGRCKQEEVYLNDEEYRLIYE